MKRSFPFRATDGELRDLEQPGYYPGYSTLVQKKAWDETTRRIVLTRVKEAPQLGFFTVREAEVLSAVVERVLPQDDRGPHRTIPILPAIDERLRKNTLNGFRYEDMPPDQEAYHLAIRAIDEMARTGFGASFTELEVHRQELLLKSLHDGNPDPPHEVWQGMPVHRFWALLMEDCVTTYYAHPWAWDEIGYGGPAYPRGYMRLEHGLPEPWEVDERRYDWSAPADSVSDLAEDAQPAEQGSMHGGSH